jgi:hypothetical protein
MGGWYEWAINLIKAAVRDRFYGRITLHFEAGKIVHMKREQTLKPPKDDKP